MLRPLTEAARIAQAVRRIERALKGARVRNVELRWRGGRAVVDMQWRADELLWWHLGGRAADRFWFVLGHGQRPASAAVPGCEINLRKSGFDRRIAGALLEDGKRVYLAHGGHIGGSRPGADKAAFRRFLVPGNWHRVHWPDGAESELQLVAEVGSPRFARQLGRFVREITRFKARAVDPKAPKAAPLLDGAAGAVALPDLCDQGLVLDALDAELRRRGVDRGGKEAADLFAHRFRGRRRIVELAVDASEDGIYCLIGRLLARGAEFNPPARLVAVLPQELPSWTEASLRRLDIGLVRFGWKGDRVVFDGLDGALG